MIAIVDVEVHLGEQRALVDSRSSVLSSHYGNILDGTFASCQPFGVSGSEVHEAVIADYFTDTEQYVSTFSAWQFASDSASLAASNLKNRINKTDQTEIDALIYCHSSIDEGNEWVATTKVCKDLQLTAPLCFSLSQVHNCQIFVALQLAAGLVGGPAARQRIAVVAADKWLYPYFQSFGALGTFGDGAGAMLLAPCKGQAEVVVRHVELEPADSDSRIFEENPMLDASCLHDRAIAVLRRAVSAAGLNPAEVGQVISPGGSLAWIESVVARAGMGEAWRSTPRPDCGHVSAADPMSGLAKAWDLVRTSSKPTLWWNYGVNGEIGCAIIGGHQA